MTTRFILSDYMDEALGQALYDKLEDGSFAGRIPPCPGLVVFAPTLRGCEDELRSALEDWVLLGLKLKHPLPVISSIDLNEEPRDVPLETV
jgi:predicted RNase H-like HicB family nuclease